MKRYLTNEEKEDFIQSLPVPSFFKAEIRANHLKKVRDMFFPQLERKVYPETIPQIKETICKIYFRSLAEPGSPVGLWASQTMETLTQNNLSSFHTSGLEKNISAGLSRITELYNVSQSPKIVSFHFVPRQKFSSVKELKKSIRLPSVFFRDLIQRPVIQKQKPEAWEYQFAYLFEQPIQTEEWSATFYLDTILMIKNGLSLEYIVNKIASQIGSLQFRFRPHVNPPILKVIVDTSNLETNAQFSLGKSVEEEYIYKIILTNLEKIHISGVPGVEAAYFKEINGDWTYEGNGGSLISLLSHPDANPYQTKNDNMWDIYDCLGVEATTQFLVEELTRVMCENDSFIHPAHISLIARNITQEGYPMAINRHGMTLERYQPLSKISFEEFLKNLVQSVYQSEVDRTTTIDACVMTGKIPPVGTGISKIYLDVDKLEKEQLIKPNSKDLESSDQSKQLMYF